MLEFDLVYLGNRIHDARKECGLTQKELANQTGLAVKTVQDIEKGRKNPTYETLSRLICRLGVSPREPLNKSANTSDELKGERNVRSSRQLQAQGAGIFTE